MPEIRVTENGNINKEIAKKFLTRIMESQSVKK